MRQMRRMVRELLCNKVVMIRASIMLWLGLVLISFHVLLEYSSQAGELSKPPEVWINESKIKPSTEKFTLCFNHSSIQTD